MAYGSVFPVGYQQMYYPQQYQQGVTTPQNQNNSIIWVQGEAGAKSYLVAPNTTVQLWDSESQVIYLKSADASGMPSMKILDYTVRDQSQPVQTIPNVQSTEYATKKELSDFEHKVMEEIDKLSRGTEVHNE